MKTIEKRELDGIYIAGGKTISDITFHKCEFSNVMITKDMYPDPQIRTLIRNCAFTDCRFYQSCSQYSGVFEDVLFEKIKVTGGFVGLSAILFKHVTFRGKIGNIVLGSYPISRSLIKTESGGKRRIKEEELILYKKDADLYYQTVDWAMDISKGEFDTFEIFTDIPAYLIRRDNETQAVVKYNKIKEGKWKLFSKIKDTEVGMALYDAEDDCVIVAPVRDKKRYPIFMEAIHILREEGIAEMK